PTINRRVRLNVIDQGQGPAVVLIHGSGGSVADWADQIDALSVDHRVVAIDLRGHGGSEVTTDALSLQDYAEDVIDVLDELDIARAAVVGLSFGGILALQLGVLYPERLTAIVAADATGFLTEEMAAGMAQSKAGVEALGMLGNVQAMRPLIFSEAALADGAEYIGAYEERFAKTDPDGFVLLMLAVSGLSIREELATLTVPTLVMVGAEDKLLPLPLSEATAALIPGAQLEIIDGASHLANLDQPEKFTQLVREFLSRVHA
ncbi:MAG: alpha/beta fold hydrolase, partial [Mycetocola sp.]